MPENKECEGEGSYCCGVRMSLAPSGIVYECLECGGWEYSSSQQIYMPRIENKGWPIGAEM